MKIDDLYAVIPESLAYKVSSGLKSKNTDSVKLLMDNMVYDLITGSDNAKKAAKLLQLENGITYSCFKVPFDFVIHDSPDSMLKKGRESAVRRAKELLSKEDIKALGL